MFKPVGANIYAGYNFSNKDNDNDYNKNEITFIPVANKKNTFEINDNKYNKKIKDNSINFKKNIPFFDSELVNEKPNYDLLFDDNFNPTEFDSKRKKFLNLKKEYEDNENDFLNKKITSKTYMFNNDYRISSSLSKNNINNLNKSLLKLVKEFIKENDFVELWDVPTINEKAKYVVDQLNSMEFNDINSTSIKKILLSVFGELETPIIGEMTLYKYIKGIKDFIDISQKFTKNDYINNILSQENQLSINGQKINKKNNGEIYAISEPMFIQYDKEKQKLVEEDSNEDQVLNNDNIKEKIDTYISTEEKEAIAYSDNIIKLFMSEIPLTLKNELIEEIIRPFKFKSQEELFAVLSQSIDLFNARYAKFLLDSKNINDIIEENKLEKEEPEKNFENKVTNI